MRGTLEELIAGAPARLDAAETEEEQKLAKQRSELAGKEAIAFQNHVRTVLGPDVLASLDAVSYGANPGSCAMRFQVNGKDFALRQAIGSVVNLLAGSREIYQFNLSNPQAKDRFLEALGDELASTP